MFDATMFETATIETTMVHPSKTTQLASHGMGWRRAARALFGCLAMAAVYFSAVTASAQSTWTVNTLADSTDGGCGSTCSLRDAIAAANADSGSSDAGDTINFQAGLVGTITLSNTLTISSPMTINGPGQNLLTVSGGGAQTVFSVTGGTQTYPVSISGLTIANGNAPSGAGGDISNTGSLSLANSIVTGGVAAGGGGIYNAGILNIVASTLSGNSSTGNSDSQVCGTICGGAILSTGSVLSVQGSTISGNTSILSGGAIYSSSAAKLINSTISGNWAGSGGTIASAASLTVISSTVSQNMAQFSGIFNENSPLTVLNSILDACYGCTTLYPGPVSNTGNLNNNLIGTGFETLPAGTLGPLAWNGGLTQTMMPLPGSAAICAGSSSSSLSGAVTLTADQRGFGFNNATCSAGQVDQGAVQTNYLQVTTLTDQTSGNPDCLSGTGTACSLRDALTLANAPYPTGADITFLPTLFPNVNGVATPGTINLQTGTNTPLPIIAGNLNLAGPGATTLTVTGGSSATVGSIFSLAISANATISGVTISGTGALTGPYYGGGIYNAGGSLALNNASITNNYAIFSGGGIYNGGTLTVFDSTIANNPGGGICNCGGIINNGFAVPATLVLTNSTVAGNTTTSAGAGIDNDPVDELATLVMNNSTISGNTSSYNCQAGGVGCGNAGGGIYNSGVMLANNSIVAGNFQWQPSGPIGDDCYNCGTQSTYNLIGTSADPIAAPLGSLGYSPSNATVQTMLPLPGSSPIGDGSVALLPGELNTVLVPGPDGLEVAQMLGVLATDERGFPRVVNGALDLGAAQTNYFDIAFSTQPEDAVAGSVMSVYSDPSVGVYETNGIGMQSLAAGIPVTLSFSGGASEMTGIMTETTTPLTVGAIPVATFNDLTPNTVGMGFTFNITSPTSGFSNLSGNSLISDSFNVVAPNGVNQVDWETGPTNPVAMGGNAGTVQVAEYNGSSPVYSTGDIITLTVTYPDNSTQIYTAATVNGIASFNLSNLAYTVPGNYEYEGSFYGLNTGPAFVGVTQQTQVVVSYPTSILAGIAGTGTVTVEDAGGNTVQGFNGAATVTTSESSVAIPVTINGGIGTFSATFATAGTNQSIAASVTGLTSVPETGITVTAIPSFVVTVATDTTNGVASDCPGSSCSLRDALAAASNAGGGNITFNHTAQTITLNNSFGTLQVGPFTNITGPTIGSGATLTNLVTVDGNGSNTVFTVSDLFYDGSAIANLNIQNGNGGPDPGGAGGINIVASVLAVTNCVFKNNQGTDAGAIFDNGGILTVTGSTFTGNQSFGGDGDGDGDAGSIFNTAPIFQVDSTPELSSIHISLKAGSWVRAASRVMSAATPLMAMPSSATPGNLTVTNSTFTGNSGVFTGGIMNAMGLSVSGSTFTGNTSSGDGYRDADGGAILNFSDGTSDLGPEPGVVAVKGILARAKARTALSSVRTLVEIIGSTPNTPPAGTPFVTTSTFTNNTGAYSGGIMSAYGSVLSVSFSTFNGNTSAGDGGGDPDAGALASFDGSSVGIANSTFFNNSSSSGAGAGAIVSSYESYVGAYGDTITGNSGYYGGIYNFSEADNIDSIDIENINELQGSNLLNSIVSGNSTSDTTATNDGIDPDNNGFFYKPTQGNIVGASAINLAPLGNYGGPTQTMIPLPGSSAICAGVLKMLQTVRNNTGVTLTEDQRGFSNSNANYPGYSETACVDAGAVQTSYSLTFTTEPPASVAAGPEFTTAVTLDESATPFAPGVLIPLTLNQNSGNTATLTGGSASTSNGIAAYLLSINQLETGDTLTATLSLNSLLSAPLSITSTSTDFSVVAPTIALSPATLPEGAVGVTYNQQITASGGTAPYTYTVTSGTLPTGLTLSSGGLLAGTPTATGPFPFTVMATDSLSFTGSQAYTLAPAADFTINASSASATIQPGSSASFTLTITPVGATTFPVITTLVATGLPSGATATFSPSSILAGSLATTVTMTIHVPQIAAKNNPAASNPALRLAPFSLALLLLPFAGRLRKTGKRLGRAMSVFLMLIAGMAAVAGLSGCGNTIGFFGQAPQSHQVTVTATMGTLSHSTNVTLYVQ